ncbi:hypothetical protein GCM10009069_11680 [Algimonas arctica]|uniref:Uncharacterized protein n=1 Tax=Algimonas arctica TaxID=1479486 RepID=A0A8J3G231_9PROT|nr:DUF6090 family protein [Algimonas arctica]GHA90434.1 hypothetical protein GCM10009069_11680 [Algimonas arctica]
MRLRSVTKNVKDQNWLAVALDFFIVVTGILIAFQITNWSETRQDRTREQQIVSRLHADFEALGRRTEEKIEYFESSINEIEEFRQLIINYPESADIQQIKVFFETSFNLPSPSGQSDTYAQLVASGDMKLLSNDTLRDELVSHAALTGQFMSGNQSVREWSRPYLTALVRLGALIEEMAMDEAVAMSGSKADLIVGINLYQGVFAGQLSVNKSHQESFAKLIKMLAEESSK